MSASQGAVRDEEEVRRALEREVGTVSPGIWEYLVAKRYVSDVQHGDSTVHELADDYRLVATIDREPGPRSDRQPPDMSLAPDEHLRVVAQVLAEWVEGYPEVQRFRQEHLSAGLFTTTSALEAWVAQQAERDGPLSRWADAPYTPQDDLPCDPSDLSAWPWTSKNHGIPSAPRTLLPFRVQVAAGGVLDELYLLGRDLEIHVGWPPAALIIFVLTGVVPELPRATASWLPVMVGWPAHSRVRLDVHPSTSPAVVAALYRQYRQSWLGLRQVTRQRPAKRPMSLLVAFIRERLGIPWRERFDAWNGAHPQYAYGHLEQMQRDYTRAIKAAPASE